MAGLCIPDTAIWPDPSVLPVDPGPDATTDEIAAYALAEQQVEIATQLAWSTLQTLSGYSLALCPITVRPASQECRERYWGPLGLGVAPLGLGSPFTPYVLSGEWFNIWCGCGIAHCGHTTTNGIQLNAPVGKVDSVIIDGDTLATDAYRVDDNLHLVRQDGQGWPLCQNLNLPAGSDGTWTVTYWQGIAPDLSINYAAGVLASEYLAAVLGNDCRLPSGTTTIVRQGVTIEMTPDWFQNSRTGIPEVDVVLARLNPFGLRGGAALYNPDRKRQRQTSFGG